MGRVETDVKDDIAAYLRGLDATYFVKFGGSASAAKGTPDFLVCHHGTFVGLELKRPDGSYGTTHTQEMRLAAIERAGGRGFVVKSIEDTAAALASLREETPQ